MTETREMLDEGVALVRAGHYEEAAARFEQVVDRFGEGADPALRGDVARALIYRAVSLPTAGRWRLLSRKLRAMFDGADLDGEAATKRYRPASEALKRAETAMSKPAASYSPRPLRAKYHRR